MARTFVIASSQKIQKSAVIHSAYPYTISCWVRPAAVNVTQTAIGHAQATVGSHHIALGILNTGKPFMETLAAAGGLTQHATSAVVNTWGHLLGLGTSATSRNVYWNGTAGTVDVVNTAHPTITRVAIGLLPETTDSSKFGGDIAEYAEWSVALNAEEIAALAAGISPLLIRPQSLLVYIPLWGLANERDYMANGPWTHTNAPAASVNHSPAFKPIAQFSFIKPSAVGPATLFGATALPVTYGHITAARRQTFSTVVGATSFGAAVAGSRKALGAVALPMTAAITTSAIRKALSASVFAIAASITTQARRKTFGVTAAPVLFGSTTQARRKTFSAVAAPFTFGAATQAIRRAYGAITAPFTLAALTQARRKTFSVSVAPFSFGATTQARRKTFSATVTPLAFSSTTAGRRRTTSAVAAPFSFASTTQARRKTFGAVTAPFTVGAFTAGFITGGIVTRYGAVALPMSATIAVTGRRKTFSASVRPFSFTAVTQARRKTFSSATAPFNFGAATQARRRTFGAAVAPFSFSSEVLARVGAIGQIALPLAVDIFTDGLIVTDDPGITRLDRADAVYINGQPVDRIYAGSSLDLEVVAP